MRQMNTNKELTNELFSSDSVNVAIKRYKNVRLEIAENDIDNMVKFAGDIARMPKRPTLEQITALAESYQLTTDFNKYLDQLKNDKEFEKFIANLTVSNMKRESNPSKSTVHLHMVKNYRASTVQCANTAV